MSSTHTVYCTKCGTDVLSTFKMCPSCGGREFSNIPIDPTDLKSSGSDLTSGEARVQSSTRSDHTLAPGAPSLRGARPGYDVAGVSFAGFWIRVAAYLIDGLIIAVVALVFALIWGFLIGISISAGISFWSDQELYLRVFITTSVIRWLYFALMESSSWQATLGKRALGLRVVDENGQRISFLRATGRYLGKYISEFLLFLPYLMVAFTQKKQGLHDMMANTLVIQD